MPKSEPSAKITEFVGLNNRAEPRTMTPGELTQADNIDIDDRKRIRRRRGYADALELDGLTSAWVTPDEQRLFAVADGSLYEIRGDSLDAVELADGLSDGETHWDWDRSKVFVSNPAGDMVIDGDEAYPLAVPTPLWPSVTVVGGNLPAGRYLVATLARDARGREGGLSIPVTIDLDEPGGLQVVPSTLAGVDIVICASRTNGEELRRINNGATHYTDLEQLGATIEEIQYNGSAFAPGGPVAWHAGRLVKATDGYVGLSHPYWPHMFELGRHDFAVPGVVRALADVQQSALLVCTDIGIWRYHMDEGLQQVADYGVPPGCPVLQSIDGPVYFWTYRGLCRAFPFENMTEARLSAAPGKRAAIGRIDLGGFERIVAITADDGEEAANNSAR